MTSLMLQPEELRMGASIEENWSHIEPAMRQRPTDHITRPTNYQNRGLCGLREPLLQQDHHRHRRRSGDLFRKLDTDNPIPIKRKFHQNQDPRQCW